MRVRKKEQERLEVRTCWVGVIRKRKCAADEKSLVAAVRNGRDAILTLVICWAAKNVKELIE